jgi:threonine dehydrogenase-like Zn-dependent dehydrogenase
VFSIDHVTSRLEKARSIGSIPIDFTKGDPVKQILAIEPNGVTRTCDCVGFECVNDKLEPDEGIIIQRAVELTSTNGGIGVAGVYLSEDRSKGAPLAQGKRSASVKFPISDFWTKNLSMQAGIVSSTVLAPTLLGLIESGRAKPSFVLLPNLESKRLKKHIRRSRSIKRLRYPSNFRTMMIWKRKSMAKQSLIGRITE